jgi:hypothetical protein
LAASGPATPSIAPWPNSSDRFAQTLLLAGPFCCYQRPMLGAEIPTFLSHTVERW